MWNWAIIFFIVAVVSAILGFSGVAVASAGVAKILFFLFVILFVISLVAGLARRAQQQLREVSHHEKTSLYFRCVRVVTGGADHTADHATPVETLVARLQPRGRFAISIKGSSGADE